MGLGFRACLGSQVSKLRVLGLGFGVLGFRGQFWGSCGWFRPWLWVGPSVWTGPGGGLKFQLN